MIEGELVQGLRAEIEGMKRQYKSLVELNRKNCDEAIRIKSANDLSYQGLLLGFQIIEDKDKEIERLKEEIKVLKERLEKKDE